MSRAAPLRSLVMVVGGWTLLRVAVTFSGTAISSPTASIPSSAPTHMMTDAVLMAAASVHPPAMLLRPRDLHGLPKRASMHGILPGGDRLAFLAPMLASYVEQVPAAGGAPVAEAPAPTDRSTADGPLLSLEPGQPSPLGSRWSGSAWLLARGGEARSVGRAGEIGGSQAGARVAYRLDDAGHLAIFARGYAPLRRSGAEVSAGVEWRPSSQVPVRLAVERRQRVTEGGRSAWMASAVGGIYAEPLPGVLRVDGYAQAGIVGVHSRDLFADGSVRAGYPAQLGGGATVTLGAGLWGATQPRAKRLDVGPQAALRFPVEQTTLLIAADYRLRVAGGAQPKSGPAITVGMDF